MAKKILVIDDEPAIRRAISQMLARAGYDVVEATDGIEGLQQVRDHMPDLVITDIMMPNKEGIETIRDLRREAPDMRILVMSGNPGSSLYLQIATMLGAHSSLSKPFRSAELLASVGALIGPGEPTTGAAPG